jgi:hypothetical protein
MEWGLIVVLVVVAVVDHAHDTDRIVLVILARVV